MTEQRQLFYQEFARNLARQIVPSDEIKSFVGNHPTLIGAFAEAQVRKFGRQVVFPLRVSHGAIITPESFGVGRAKQVDTIVWVPNPLPHLFEIDEFALIPWTSSMGILEIKSSAYKNAGKQIAEVLDMEGDLTLGRIPAETRGIPAALGVIVLKREPITDPKLKELIGDQKVVTLIRQLNHEYIPNTEALLKLVNFLADIRKRARQLGDIRIESVDFSIYPHNTATSI